MSSARTTLIRFCAAALASAAALGGAGTAAGGATTTGPTGTTGNGGAAGTSGSLTVPATLEGIKTKAATDITNRVNDLDSAISKVNAARGLGDGQSTIATYLGTDVSALQQLNATIQGDTTVEQAAHDFSTAFTNYRVYVLVLPSARIAAEADRATSTTLPALTADAAKATSHVNPRNSEFLQPLIDDLNHQISTASDALNGLAATVLADTPPQWNANHGLLSPARSAEQSADAAIKQGRSDVQDIVGAATAGVAATTTTTG
jgi:hypothetical protein